MANNLALTSRKHVLCIRALFLFMLRGNTCRLRRRYKYHDLLELQRNIPGRVSPPAPLFSSDINASNDIIPRSRHRRM